MRGLVTDTLVIALVSSLPALAQPTAEELMPTGWRDLPAEDFLAAAEGVLVSDGGRSSGREVIEAHAWERFLSDPGFVAGAEWDTVFGMLTLATPESATGADNGPLTAAMETIGNRLGSSPSLIAAQDLYDLRADAKALHALGRDPSEDAPLYVEWMRANPDWPNILRVQDAHNLVRWIGVDTVDWRHFSARWTGTITAPTSGAYVFRLVRGYAGTESQVRVWVGGTLVLDSTLAGRTVLESEPVAMRAGEPAAFRAEMIHDSDDLAGTSSSMLLTWRDEIGGFGLGAPTAALTWRGPAGGETLVPSAAFAPPNEAGQPGATGLRAQYYSDTRHGRLASTRLDETLDLAWVSCPVAPAAYDDYRSLLRACSAKLIDDAYLGAAARDGDDRVFDYTLWRVAYQLPLTARQELVETLLRDLNVVRAMSTEAMGRLMQAVCMLPSKEHLELVGLWSQERPQPRFEPGTFPGWEDDSFFAKNTGYFWLLGQFLVGPYWDDATYLADNYLTLPDGGCNVALAYALAFAASENRGRDDSMDLLLSRIDERVADAELGGDQRASWLFARSFARSVPPRGGRIRLMRGYDDLVEASLFAETNDRRFWCLQERVARLVAVGEFHAARELMDRLANEFSIPSQVESLARWRSDADRVESVYTDRSEQEATLAESAYQAEVNRRRRSE